MRLGGVLALILQVFRRKPKPLPPYDPYAAKMINWAIEERAHNDRFRF